MGLYVLNASCYIMTDNNHNTANLQVPASYTTPAVLLIYTVKSGKSFARDRGKNKSKYRVRDSLLLEIWIFCSGQPVRGDRILFVKMTSTYKHRSLVGIYNNGFNSFFSMLSSSSACILKIPKG
jgi:hypothetical protein